MIWAAQELSIAWRRIIWPETGGNAHCPSPCKILGRHPLRKPTPMTAERQKRNQKPLRDAVCSIQYSPHPWTHNNSRWNKVVYECMIFRWSIKRSCIPLQHLPLTEARNSITCNIAKISWPWAVDAECVPCPRRRTIEYQSHPLCWLVASAVSCDLSACPARLPQNWTYWDEDALSSQGILKVSW